MYFFGKRERDVVCFLPCAGICIGRRFHKDERFGLYIGAGANFMPTGGSLEDKQIVTHHMGRNLVLNWWSFHSQALVLLYILTCSERGRSWSERCLHLRWSRLYAAWEYCTLLLPAFVLLRQSILEAHDCSREITRLTYCSTWKMVQLWSEVRSEPCILVLTRRPPCVEHSIQVQ